MLAWYRDHLGLPTQPWGAPFLWQESEAPDKTGYTVWSPFDADSTYFAPSKQSFMINYRVDDLEALLADLKAKGVTVVGEMQTEPNGKFGWILDPEGNKIELWEPVDPDTDPYLPK